MMKFLWAQILLGPDNKVVVAPGPLSGVFMPSSGKVQFGAKSPATGIMGDANMGGHFAVEIKIRRL